MPKPAMTKMTPEELAIWQRLERMKAEASKLMNDAKLIGAVGVQPNPTPEMKATQDYWYQRGKVEAALEMLGFMKFGE